jgi:glycosyltransferase involved in cell wall biosynthesis
VWHARIASRDVLLDNFLVKNTSRIIAVSQAVKKRFSGLGEKKVSIIYNGVDIKKFIPGFRNSTLADKFGINKKDCVVSVVGRFSPEKGHRYLVGAVELIKNEIPNLKILMIGTGNSESTNNLKREIKRSGTGSNFIFTGFTDNTAEMLKLSDMFCLPSLSEGFSRSLLEAMACGLPVIATSVGGNAEIVKNGVNGILVPPKNPDALAEAIKELSGSREKAGRMGSEARKLTEEKFSIEGNSGKTENLYEEIINKYMI